MIHGHDKVESSHQGRAQFDTIMPTLALNLFDSLSREKKLTFPFSPSNFLWGMFEEKCHIDGLAQDGPNSIANALELCLSCTNPSTSWWLLAIKLNGT